ncbi:NADH-quinone oxidoreductase subunit NuoI [Enterobacteriaceae endosymbiont of Neohaemonia nigricornis]|uniref:NADH-quinone oxidoreductase subunit NuoI n=1 Tax=Enterobacteriaceae endosymbiont of Neohaemonia nigricornis TaxID=2675792 RepID=UPI00144985F1|nr:NADH-quinone oxidoreductase subunit NuoI [Enterobacteriaceae endosymbiont of Neohaemonia nigricornis]QJC30547.1 NADH-quinone oxidoreductase subunit NuoI [Enterobacteriaceae endosymbiont of Neohaemonia nigricornis]
MKIKQFFIDIYSQIRSILLILKNFIAKRETIKYPEEKVYLPPRYRGRIILTSDKNNNERCVACNLCAVVCPVSCISLKKSIDSNNRSYPKFFRINLSRCIFCGFCEEACPTGAIQLTPDFELCEFDRNKLIYEKDDLLIKNEGKYKKYDFYNVSGIKIKNHPKKNKKQNIVNTKSLLP